MFCATCGANNPGNASNCTSCGKPLVVNPYQASGAAGAMRPNVKFPTYLGQSIAVTLCCCLPFGIVAIVYASQVDKKLLIGDIEGAAAASNSAKIWSWVAFGCGMVIGLAWVALRIAFYALPHAARQ